MIEQEIIHSITTHSFTIRNSLINNSKRYCYIYLQGGPPPTTDAGYPAGALAYQALGFLVIVCSRAAQNADALQLASSVDG